MEFQLSYFKSWKMMLCKCCTQHASKFGKLSSGHRTVFIPTQEKGNAKECSNYHTVALISVQFSSSLSRVRFFVIPWIAALQVSLSWVYPNSCSLSRWCHPASSSSAISFSSHLQSFPASGSFPVSQFFTSGGQRIGISASASVLPMNIQDWSPLGWTGWISLQSKGLSRVFSNITVQKHQFFSIQLSS